MNRLLIESPAAVAAQKKRRNISCSICSSSPCKCRCRVSQLAPLIPSFFTELCGAAAWTLVGSGAAAAGFSPTGVAVAHGFVLFVIVETYLHISGAHLNPLVTLALWILKEITWLRALIYMVAHFAGAIGAGALLLAIFGGSSSLGTPVVSSGSSRGIAILVEALLSYGVLNVILHSLLAKRKQRHGLGHGSLAIGFSLTAAHFFGQSISGAAVSPARALGPAIFSGLLNDIWIYFVGPVAGAAAAVLNYWWWRRYYPVHC